MNKQDIPFHINSRQAAKDNGYKFFHGSPCKNGHDGLRYSGGHCVECQIEKMSTDKAKERKKEYRASNHGKSIIEKYNKQYYYSDLENQRKRCRDYHKNNPEKQKQWKLNNPEKVKAWLDKWRKENRHISRMHEETRRARLFGNGGSHTHEQAEQILIKQKHKCIYCNKKLTKNNMHKDHIMPLYLGGTNNIDNIQWLCVKCNLKKHKKDPIEWAQINGKLL